jgi:hypothetical protein
LQFISDLYCLIGIYFKPVSKRISYKLYISILGEAAALRPLLARLARIEQKLDKCLNQQELILQHMGMTSGPIEDLPSNIQLPVATAPALAELNTTLANQDIRILVVSKLKLCN